MEATSFDAMVLPSSAASMLGRFSEVMVMYIFGSVRRSDSMVKRQKVSKLNKEETQANNTSQSEPKDIER